jgi:hypothetical protein
MPSIANQFPSSGDWLFSYMDKFYDDGSTNYTGADPYYNSAISSMGGGPSLWGIGFLDIPLKYGRTYAQTNRDASWDNLRSWLESWNNRNLYYFGHGAPNNIGGDENITDISNNITAGITLPNSHALLTSQWVASNVTKNKNYGPMPFRFVFLDGCDTAAGNWPAAWGVPNQVEPLIHQTMKKVEGSVTFHTAMSTAFPQPEPGKALKPGPMKVDAGKLRAHLGITDVNYLEGKASLAIIDSTLI